MDLTGETRAKKLFLAAITGLAAMLLVNLARFQSIACYVKVDGQVIGVVKDPAVVENLVEELKAGVESRLEAKVVLQQGIRYEELPFRGDDFTPESTLKEKLENSVKFAVQGCAINVDGRDVAFLKSVETAEDVLSRVITGLLSGISTEGFESVGFFERVKIVKKPIPIEVLEKPEDVLARLSQARNEVRKYQVQKGDTVWGIAKRFKLDLEDIIKANPGIDADRIQIGQELNLDIPRYFLNLKLVRNETYEESIPFDVQYEETSELYKGQQQVKVEGKEGKKLVEAQVIEVNGIEEERKVIREKVVLEPKTAVVERGTRERPRTLAYGEFVAPCRGAVTSRFGWRESGRHTGIDIGVPVGTSVKAADGGKVTFAGWLGGYGRLVIIDHENGYSTYYGHNSSLKVKAGERVYRGQVIALSGASGNVTGPHLHFEVRKNGVPVDPSKFINY